MGGRSDNLRHPRRPGDLRSGAWISSCPLLALRDEREKLSSKLWSLSAVSNPALGSTTSPYLSGRSNRTEDEVDEQGYWSLRHRRGAPCGRTLSSPLH